MHYHRREERSCGVEREREHYTREKEREKVVDIEAEAYGEHHWSKSSFYDEGMLPIYHYNEELSLEENYATFMNIIEYGSVYQFFDHRESELVLKNLKTIVELYPEVVESFLKSIKQMKQEIMNIEISFDSSFLKEFSSFDWKPSRMLLKGEITEDDERYKELKQFSEENKTVLDTVKFNKQLQKEVLWSIDKLEETLLLLLRAQKGILPDVRNYKNRTSLCDSCRSS